MHIKLFIRVRKLAEPDDFDGACTLFANREVFDAVFFRHDHPFDVFLYLQENGSFDGDFEYRLLHPHTVVFHDLGYLGQTARIGDILCGDHVHIRSEKKKRIATLLWSVGQKIYMNISIRQYIFGTLISTYYEYADKKTA